jgi:hypothetical protein
MASVERLAMVRKYSSPEYAKEFTDAVELWDKSSLLIVCWHLLEDISSRVQNKEAFTTVAVHRFVLRDKYSSLPP